MIRSFSGHIVMSEKDSESYQLHLIEFTSETSYYRDE